MELDITQSGLKARRIPISIGSRYVLTSQASEDAQNAIVINSNYVRPDHAILSSTENGWYLTPRFSQVQIDGEDAPVGLRQRLKDSASWKIGNVHFSLIGGAQDVVSDGEISTSLTPKQAYNKLVLDIQKSTIERTSHLVGERKLETLAEDYWEKATPILVTELEHKIEELPPNLFNDCASEILRREVILRLLGHGGYLSVETEATAETQKRRLTKAVDKCASIFGLTFLPDNLPAELEHVNATFDLCFQENSVQLLGPELKTLLTEATRLEVKSYMGGNGPIDMLLRLEPLSEIMVTDYDTIFVETYGNILQTGLCFASSDAANEVAVRIARNLDSRSLKPESPYVDTRLADGSRVNIVIHPLSQSGITITIRKFRDELPDEAFYLEVEAMSEAMMSFLKGCVVSKRNILVAGGTGTGKTTLTNFLCSMIPKNERIITVEDTTELKVSTKDGGLLPHVVALQTIQRPKPHDPDEFSIRTLVRNALRMRPDRIIVGECRGGEAFDMLQAMNTGHEGSMTTIHANTPDETMARLENLVRTAKEDLPTSVIRFQVATAIDYVVQLRRFSDGCRKVTTIAEVGDLDPITGRVEVNQIFETVYNPLESEKGTRFMFAGRQPDALREIIEGGFDPELLMRQYDVV